MYQLTTYENKQFYLYVKTVLLTTLKLQVFNSLPQAEPFITIIFVIEYR